MVAGRPLKEIDWEFVELQMQAGCKAIEIYPELGITDNTFYQRFKDYFGEKFQDYFGKMHSVGDGKIKTTQFVKALEGNPQMLTILGRERLGQDKEKDSKIVSPIQDQIDLRHENMLLKAELESLKANANKS